VSRRFAEPALLAARAHAGQLRRGGDVPYINHPLAVAAMAAAHTEDEDVLCAALLHDVVEETDVTPDQVRATSGERVAGFVDELTDPGEWDDLPTPDRKMLQAQKVSTASAGARLVKIADQWANVSDLATMDTGKSAASLRAYRTTARAVVEACRSAAPDMAQTFDVAAARLDQRISEMPA